MKFVHALFIMPALSLSLSGCLGSTMQHLFQPDPKSGDVTAAGTAPIFNSDTGLPRIDITKLLRASLPSSCKEKNDQKDDNKDRQDDIEEAYAHLRDFRNCDYRFDKELTRNGIQDLILATSDQHCEVYTKMLSLADSDSGLFFGATSTLLGGLSAIFTNATTARALGGSAGIMSGIGAEVQHAYLKQQTVPVIVSGIRMAQLSVHSEIAGGQAKSLRSYTLERAIKDAIRYNEACSIAAGLDKVKDQIKEAGSPGIDTMLSVQRKLAISRLESHLDFIATDPTKNRREAKAIEERLRVLKAQGESSDDQAKAGVASSLGKVLDAEMEIAYWESEQQNAQAEEEGAQMTLDRLTGEAAAAKEAADAAPTDAGLAQAAANAKADLDKRKPSLEQEIARAAAHAQLAQTNIQAAQQRLGEAQRRATFFKSMAQPTTPESQGAKPAAEPELVATIRFETGSHSISGTNFDNLAEAIKARKPARLVVIGHSDRIGTEDAILDTSVKRAVAVATWLQRDVVPGVTVEHRAAGASDCPAGDDANPACRRVDIFAPPAD